MTTELVHAAPWIDDYGFSMRRLPSERYDLHEVITDNDEHFVIKTCGPEAAADLGNATAWAQWIQAQNPQSFNVPHTHATITAEPNGQLVTARSYTDWVEGRHPAEDQLAEFIPPLVGVIGELSQLEVAWTGSSSDWLKRKLDILGRPALEHIGDPTLSDRVTAAIDSHVSAIKPGVVHGDLVPKNMLIAPTNAHKIYILDAEFGSHGSRPHFALPRMRDAAYLYHVLQVQYQQPETAELLYKKLGEQFTDDSTWQEEFWLCVIERSLSMYTHFVVNNPPQVDIRRLNPEKYINCLHTALDQLAA